MSPESEPLRRVPTPAGEPDAEREVDFGRYAGTLADKWWLLLLGIVLGAIVGYLFGQTGGSTYQAQATVFLGQTISPLGTPVPTLSSDPSGVATIARSQAVVNEVAEQVGMSPAKLRRGISSSLLGERNRQTTNVALVGITVRGSNADNVEQAANLIAEEVVSSVSVYADSKIDTLQQRLEALQAQLDSVGARIDDLTAQIEQSSGASTTDQLLLTNLLATLEQQRADLTDRVFAAEQALESAEEVERGRVVTPAAATKVDARSTRSSVVVGAFLGLVLAALVALLWASVSRLRAS